MNVFRQVLLWLGLSGAVAQAAAWPMFRGGPALLGVAEDSLPARLELLWSFKTAGPVKSSAAIDPEMSRAITMSTPCVVTFWRSDPFCGRAIDD